MKSITLTYWEDDLEQGISKEATFEIDITLLTEVAVNDLSYTDLKDFINNYTSDDVEIILDELYNKKIEYNLLYTGAFETFE